MRKCKYYINIFLALNIIAKKRGYLCFMVEPDILNQMIPGLDLGMRFKYEPRNLGVEKIYKNLAIFFLENRASV